IERSGGQQAALRRSSRLDPCHVRRRFVAGLHRRIDPQCRFAGDPRRDRRQCRGSPVGGQHLHPAARRIDPARWLARRPPGAAAVLVALAGVAEVRESETARLDAGGAALATLGLGAATYGLTLWSQTFVLTPAAAVPLVIGVALLLGFVFYERRLGSKAMIPVALFAENRCFSALNLMTFLLYGAFGGSLLLIPYVLIEVGHYSPIEAGLSLLPLSIMLGLGSPMMGKLAVRLGPRIPLTAGP